MALGSRTLIPEHGRTPFKALWLSQEGNTVSLMARTGSAPVGLDVQIGGSFKGRVVAVDNKASSVYVRPLAARKHHETLEDLLNEIDASTYVKPTGITPGYVYLVKVNPNGGGPFRGVITKEESPTQYTVFDVDSGMVASVSGENLVQLPPTLRKVPPLVLCLAVSSTALDTRSPNCLKKDSIVICKIDSDDLMAFLNGNDTYPPVLTGEVQLDPNATNEMSQVPADHSDCFVYRHSRPLMQTDDGQSGMENGVADLEGKISGGAGDPRSPHKFKFVPYMASPLPCQRTARVSRVIDVDFYAMRDTMLLTDLYEFVRRPVKRVEVSQLMDNGNGLPCIVRTPRPGKKEARLYRALAKHYEPERGTCMAYLIDYDQSVECDISSVFDIAEQPSEVREIPTAAFFFNAMRSTYGRRNGAGVGQLRQDDQYTVCLLSENDGSYTGTVWMPTMSGGGSGRRQIEEAERLEEQRRIRAEEEKANREEMRRMEAELKEKAEALRRERELFEISKRRRTQELSLVTMQLQVANISRKMDFIATTGMAAGNLGGLGGYATLCATAATLNNAIMQQHWQQTTSHTVNTVASHSTTTNQAIINMQQMLRLAAPFGIYSNNMTAQGNESSVTNPIVQLPEGSSPLSPSTRADYSQSAMSDAFNGNNRSEHAEWNGWGAGSPRGPMEFVNSRMGNRMDTRTPFNASSGRMHIPNNGGSYDRGTNEYGESSGFFGRRSRWTKRERDMRAGRNYSVNRNFSREYYGRRNGGNRYPRRGWRQMLCTFCQGEGHFANNCPSNMATRSDQRRGGDRQNSFSLLNKQLPSPPKSGQNTEQACCLQTFYATRPRDRDGHLLYTSDESSEDESELDQSSDDDDDDNSAKKQQDNSKENISKEPSSERQQSPGLDEEIAPAIIFSAGHIIQALNYEPYFDYVSVKDGEEYTVKRSDEDHMNANWPLFFVQIQEEQMLDFLEQYLDSLQPNDDLPDEQVNVGTLCVSYCAAFDANFRAVITNISGDEVEVLYVDYGNYETVQRHQLKSIDDQSVETRTHPAMAIPCILSGLDDGYMNGGGDLEEEDVIGMQADVSCEHSSFRLRFLSRRADGVRVVEVVR